MTGQAGGFDLIRNVVGIGRHAGCFAPKKPQDQKEPGREQGQHPDVAAGGVLWVHITAHGEGSLHWSPV